MIIKVDITPFIRELLFGHDCVIIPGYGGFIGNYTPADIDKSSGTFYPPVKKISFNRNLNHNDGLLTGRISGSLGINFDEARTLVDEYVADLRKKLGRGEKVVFDNIGSFVNNQEGNVQFEPDATANYHLDSYGLESFQCLPLEGYDVRKRILPYNERKPAKQTSVRKILWRAAVIIPLLSMMVVVPLKTDLFKAKVEATSLNPLVNAEFEHNKIAVDESLSVDFVKTEDNTANLSDQAVEAEVTESVVAETNGYCLITGSFKSEDNAVNQVNMLKADGFTPEIVEAPNGFYRVSAMVCNDLNTARVRKDSVSKKYPGTWVSRK